MSQTMNLMELQHDDNAPHVLRIFAFPPPPGALRYNFTISLIMPSRNIAREILQVNEVVTVREIVTVVRVYEYAKKQAKIQAMWHESRHRQKLRAKLFPDESLDEDIPN